MEWVDHASRMGWWTSRAVFVDDRAVVRKSRARILGGLAGKKIAVVGGTTNQRAVEAALKKQLVSATVVTVKNRDEGIAALEAGTVDALASDKILLVGLAGKVKDPSQYELLADDLGFEPYGIVLPRGDASFRLAVVWKGQRAERDIRAGEPITFRISP
jgi:ABC-type amino acid transport substrate-binding protein